MNMQRIKPILILLFLAFFVLAADAQCAMCKTAAEQSGFAAKLNTGIFYLLFAPVVVLGGIMLFWKMNKDKFSNNPGNNA